MDGYIIVLDATMSGVFEKGQVYEKLPLHCTILQKFTVKADEYSMKFCIGNVAKKTPPILLRPKGQVLFGPNNDVPAVELEIKPLRALHENLVSCLEPFNLNFENPEWARSGYRPHVTTDKFEFMNSSKFSMTSYILALVRVTKTGDITKKEIVSRYRLT